MMPVVKNDYNIYKSNRNRRVSECSNDKTSASSASSCGGTRRVHSGSRSADGPSLSTSPGSDFMVGSPAHRSLGGVSKQTAFHHGSLQHHHGVASRNSSRNSQSSLQSPAKSSSSSSSPPKVSSTSSLNMFHSKLVDKLRRSLTSKSKDSEYSSLNFENNKPNPYTPSMTHHRATTRGDPHESARFKATLRRFQSVCIFCHVLFRQVLMFRCLFICYLWVCDINV